MVECKFCGKEIGTAKYLSQNEGSCSECTGVCMKKCKKASSVKGWHNEPCVSCENNPYRKRYAWDGKEWIASDRH
jgi:hypothetical protein